MFTPKFFLGVGLALLSGIFNNLGALLEKKAVNEYFHEKIRYIQLNAGDPDAYRQGISHMELKMKDLMTTRTWLIGFCLQFFFGTAGFIGAQSLIGPSLTPALGSIGIIVLVFASCLIQERLNHLDYFGISLMTVAVFLLAFSDLVIDQSKIDYLAPYFTLRVVIFTVVVGGISAFCRLWAKKKDRFEGTLLASLVGLCIALSNYWISPLTSVGFGLVTGHATGKAKNPTFENHSVLSVVALVLVSATIVIFVNIYAVYSRQLAFRVGNAATMVPISHISSHLSSPIIYSLVFWLPQPKKYSLLCMYSGLILLIISSFIFGKREALFDSKPKEYEPASKPGESAIADDEYDVTVSPKLLDRSPRRSAVALTSPPFRPLPTLSSSGQTSPPSPFKVPLVAMPASPAFVFAPSQQAAPMASPAALI